MDQHSKTVVCYRVDAIFWINIQGWEKELTVWKISSEITLVHSLDPDSRICIAPTNLYRPFGINLEFSVDYLYWTTGGLMKLNDRENQFCNH